MTKQIQPSDYVMAAIAIMLIAFIVAYVYLEIYKA